MPGANSPLAVVSMEEVEVLEVEELEVEAAH